MHNTSDSCHICRTGQLSLFPAFSQLLQVASDCTPYPKSGRLAVCERCGTVQKVADEEFQHGCDEIYGKYSVYQQAGGVEQQVFSSQSGMPASRSSVLLDALFDAGFIPGQGELLDVGCGNGNLLKSFHARRPEWQLWGCELHDTHKAEVEALPGVAGFHAGDVAEMDRTFDMISMLHCLEHIVDPQSFLRTLRGKLKPDGLLLVEVPNFRQNPFDLIVADHAAHFTRGSLEKLLEAAGMDILCSSEEIIPKELTLLVRNSARSSRDLPASPVESDAVQASIDWLLQMRDQARGAAAQAPLGVFGTSIAGMWLLSELGDDIAFFVDEDRNRVGRETFGVQVVSPDQVERGAVLLPFPPAIAQRIAERLSGAGIKFIQPADFLV